MANFWENDEVAGGQSPARVNFWEQDALSGDAPMLESTAPTPEPEAWNPALGLSRDLVNGIPILGPMYTGAVDAVTTNLAGLLTGENPQAIKDRVYAKQDAYEEENPILSTTGQMVGGTAAMAPLGMSAAGARFLGAAPGQALLSRLGFGAGSGALISGADSLARGNDLGTAGLTALGGGLIGAGGGAVAPYIGAGFSKAGEIGRKALDMGPSAGEVGISRPAADILTDVLSADGTLGTQAGINMSNAGPRAMLADAGNNTAQLLDTAIQKSGPASRIAADAVETRASQANLDIANALDGAFGKVGESSARDLIVYGDKTNPLDLIYKRAYETPIDYSNPLAMEIEDIVGTRVPASAIKAANELMRVEGKTSQQIMANFADDGTVTFTQQPDVRQLDYITRGLNEVADQANGQGKLGGTTAIGRAYGNLSRDIRSKLKELVPEYRTALDRAATDIGKFNARQLGETVFSSGTTRAELAEELAGMSAAEMGKVREGVRQQFDDMLANVTRSVTDSNMDAREAVAALRGLSSRAARDKVEMIVGKPQAEAFFAKLDEAAKALELRASVATNSKTFARTSTDATVNSYINDGPINQALQGKPLNATQSIIQALTGRDARGNKAISDKVYSEIAQLLIQGPDAGMDLISGLATRKALAGNPRFGASLAPGAANTTTQQIAEMLLGNVPQ